MVYKRPKRSHRFHVTLIGCAGIAATLLALLRITCLPTDVPAEPMPRVHLAKPGKVNLVSCDTAFVDRALLPTSVGADRVSEMARWVSHLDDLVKTYGPADARPLVLCNDPVLRLAAGAFWFSREAEAAEYAEHLLLDDQPLPSLHGNRLLAEWLVRDVCDIWSAPGEQLVRKAASSAEASSIRVAAIDCLLERMPSIGEEELIRALRVPDTGLQYAMLLRTAALFSSSGSTPGACDHALLSQVMKSLGSSSYWVRSAALTASCRCREARNASIRIASWDPAAQVRKTAAEAVAWDAPPAPDVSIRLLVDRAEPVRRSLISNTQPAATWRDIIGNPVSLWKDLIQLGQQAHPP